MNLTKSTLFIIILDILIILISILFLTSAHGKVMGEHSYNVCLDECCRDYVNYDDMKQMFNYTRNKVNYGNLGDRCREMKDCAECIDRCWNELEHNAPNVAEKMRDIEVVKNKPSDCFMRSIK